MAAAIEGPVITPEMIDRFIAEFRTKGRAQGTIQIYQRNLMMLYDSLTAEKRIDRQTLQQWRLSLIKKGYSSRTINIFLSAANSFLSFYGYREFQLTGQLAPKEEAQPALTRQEYLRLLFTARTLRKERIYLMIKIFATTGLGVQELEKVTVESVQAACIEVSPNTQTQNRIIPSCLREELLRYIEENGICTGPVFRTRSGSPIRRSNVTDSIRHLCHTAQVAEEKGNPRCLRRLYRDTKKNIQASLDLLLEQEYTRLLEQEQLAIGWTERE